MSISKRSGTVITFYSYKGGTGRSMALANFAWILASNGLDVLAIDWDLEAPGLHRFFRPFLIDRELRNSPGLIDFAWDLAKKKVTPIPPGRPEGILDFPPLEDYVIGLDWDFGGKGSIALLPAGRQDENYAHRVNTFDWDNFYERLGGGKLLHAARDVLRADYDYILIDSRTGVSDTSSICTVQMPDVVVVCFTLNHQSIRGAAAVAASVQRQREASFRIYPVPTRLENAETDKLKSTLKFAREAFAPFLRHVQSDRSSVHLDQQQSYWTDVQTPYRTFYAFEEVPAAFKDEPGAHDSILASTERLARWLTDGTVTALQPAAEETRESVVSAFAISAEQASVVQRSVPETRTLLERFFGWDRQLRLAAVRHLNLYEVFRASAVAALGLTVLLLAITLFGLRAREQARIATERATVAEERARLAEALVAKATQPAGSGFAKDGAEVRRVPAGEFIAGADPQARLELLHKLSSPELDFYKTEPPLQKRTTGDFFIYRYEVTAGQFDVYRDAACRSGSTLPCPQGWRARFGPRTPATFVGYRFAQAYCGWVDGRLPTEDEWEKAARGVDGYTWPWGNSPDNSRFQGSSAEPRRPVDVGSHPEGDSPYGIADMSGNVWEFTSGDWKGGHAMRGGSYLNSLAESRAAVRWASSLEDPGADYLGFRCVITSEHVR